MTDLEDKLIVGAKIRIGKEYAYEHDRNEGDIITLVEGWFEYDNGLYTEDQSAPSEWDGDEFNSIYHLFGNDLESFMDCQIIDQ